MPDQANKDLVSMGDLDVSTGTEPKKDAKPADKATEPTLVEVKVGEKAYQVPAEVKAALDAASKAGVDVAEMKSQLATMSRQLAAAAPKEKADTKAEDGYSVMLFTQPDEAVERIKKEVVQAVMQSVTATNNQREFWDEFYSQHPDLKGFKEFVTFQFAQNRESYTKEGVTVGQAMEKLAEASKAGILKIRGEKEWGKQKPVGEGGSDGNSARKDKSKDGTEEDAKPSTAQILSKRAQARREARAPGRRATK